jgi:hypothetical protein
MVARANSAEQIGEGVAKAFDRLSGGGIPNTIINSQQMRMFQGFPRR